MTTALAEQRLPMTALDAKSIEQVLLGGDLSKLTPEQRLTYYNQVCGGLGLNPLTKPFAYITLNGKLQLYALKDATEQLRKIHGVSITEVSSAQVGDVFVVTAKASDRSGRTDAATGAVAIGNLKGETLANALMKAETKAKRRATLSICGLGILDETETDTIPNVQVGEPLPPVVVEAQPAPANVAGLPEGAVYLISSTNEKTSRGKPYWLLETMNRAGMTEKVIAWEQQLGTMAEQLVQNAQFVFPTFKGTWDDKRVVKALAKASPVGAAIETPIHELTVDQIPF